MRDEKEIRTMIETLVGTLREQRDADTIAALGALRWAVGESPTWTAGYGDAQLIADVRATLRGETVELGTAKPYYLQGRNRTGSDRTGKLYHALPEGSEYTFRAALCGKRPGRLSGGWAAPIGNDAEVTCPACLRRLANSQ